MQRKNTCSRCKYLDAAQGFCNFNHYCKRTGLIIADNETTSITCGNFEHKKPRAAVSIFKYVFNPKTGKYCRYYLSDEEVVQLFAGQVSERPAGVNVRTQSTGSKIEVKAVQQ